jgi:hypothetical protein
MRSFSSDADMGEMLLLFQDTFSEANFSCIIHLTVETALTVDSKEI